MREEYKKKKSKKVSAEVRRWPKLIERQSP